MFCKPHPFILRLQKDQNKFFSCYRVMNIQLLEKNDKFKVVYLNAAYPSTYYNEIIYKTQDDFYLFYNLREDFILFLMFVDVSVNKFNIVFFEHFFEVHTVRTTLHGIDNNCFFRHFNTWT